MIERQKALIPAPSHEMTVVEAAPETTAAPETASERAPGADTAVAGPKQQREVPPPPRKRVLLYVGIPLVGLLALGAYGHWRTHAAAADAQRQQQDYAPEVRTGIAKTVDAAVELTEPGQTVAFDAATLFSRATGYIAERHVDIGSRVHKGDLLLRIAAPDLDQQLLQAQAQLGQNQAALLQSQAQLVQAQANVKLANVTKYRETTLANQGWETKQNADNSTASAAVDAAGVTNAQAGIAVAAANLKAQQATVQRLQELTGFERVVAPFDGTITARNVDTGDLVTADSSTGTPLLSIERDDVLRVAVYIPQSSAIGIHAGLAAKVTVPELPGRTFDATVSRTGHALDPTSRSLLTEVDIDNSQGVLSPGLYADVTVSVPREHPGVIVPDEALVFNADGLQVVTAADDGRVQFHKVSIYRDFGTSAELRDGLQGGERLILTPPVDITNGSKVRFPPPQGGKAPADRGAGVASNQSQPEQTADRGSVGDH